MLAYAAEARRDYTFLLIGPDFDGTLAASHLTRLPNVRWLCEKRYEDLPSYLYYFSAATIPFLIDDITKATSPVKLFEYMAGGKPIVTTDMPECRQYPCVLVARDREEYVEKLDEAIRRGKQEPFGRLLDREAANNTWETRGGQIIARIKALNGRSTAHGTVARPRLTIARKATETGTGVGGGAALAARPVGLDDLPEGVAARAARGSNHILGTASLARRAFAGLGPAPSGGCRGGWVRPRRPAGAAAICEK